MSKGILSCVVAHSFQDDLYVYPLHIVFAGLLNIAILKVLDLVLLVMLLLYMMCWYGRKCIRLRIKYLLTIVLLFFFISAFLARLNTASALASTNVKVFFKVF